MKFSTTLAATSSLVASAYAAPAARSNTNVVRAMNVSATTTRNNTFNLATTGETYGAAYFITNDPTGNYIVAADINADGSLTLASAVSTGGLGEHGNVTGADPLYSQGAIVVNTNASMLATVNAGSNTVSLFSIDPSTPSSLTAIGAPVSSGGEFPQSVAFNDAGDKLCALNGGSIDGVQCFWVNATTGLKPITNSRRYMGLNQTTPATGVAGTASHIIFSADQNSVYAATKGNPAVNTTGYIAAWDISDAGLSEEAYRLDMPTGGNLPFSIGLIPGTNGSLLVTDAAVGYNIFDFSKGVPASLDSNATVAVPVEGQGAVCWNAYSPKTGSFYLTDFLTNLVTEVAVDATTLNATQIAQYDTQGNAGLIDLEVASFGGNDYLYVAMGTAAAIQVFSLDAPGQATRVQTVDLSGPAFSVGLALTGENIQGMAVYVKPQ
ncbi:hypothetical protein PENSPDRAFT_663971 [Peniophora sp. CONT]|nr:hypothetical protein PENSPDRAFT_663971 [Peniophora sp. CONT]